MNVAIIGHGKMGQAIERIASERGHEAVFIADKEDTGQIRPENLKNTDVAFEFTEPGSAVENYKKLFAMGIAVVSGTTGWMEQYDEVVKMCKAQDSGFFYASNFSLGVNLFFALNKKLAALMGNFAEYRPEISEIHHIHKKDAPSGTAIELAKDIVAAHPIINEWAKGETQAEGKLPVVSYREDEVPGIHHVQYSSVLDTIEIRHTARTRDAFALGAVIAGEFIKDKKGIYSMEDLLAL